VGLIVLPSEAVGGDAAPTAAPDELHVKHQDFPLDWLRRLREVSPISEIHSWLSPRWFADAQRWLLYECVPIRYVTDNDLIADLQGPDPDSAEADELDKVGRGITVSRYQQEMFRKHRVHARPSWVIQGPNGGHQVSFGESTKELCRARGLPTEPPKPGDLPYAPFDERVVAQVQRMNKLVKVRGDLGEFKKRFGNASSWRREKREALRDARAEMVHFLNTQLEYGDDHLTRAVAKGEVDDVPVKESDWVKENEDWDARYIERGL
jgi:hypothetical protein